MVSDMKQELSLNSYIWQNCNSSTLVEYSQKINNGFYHSSAMVSVI